MRKLIIVLVFVTLCNCIQSQNLVPNGSFEYVESCDNHFLKNAKPWFDPAMDGIYHANIVDIFNSCWTDENLYYRTPANAFGFQYPRTGKGYVNIPTYSNQNELRQYIEVKLKQPLDNKKYNISFYVSLNDRATCATNNLGVYFSNDSVFYPAFKLMNVISQFNNDSLIKDSVNWVKVSGIYNAQGDENFMTIGNFLANSNTNIYILDSSINELVAGYYIDDIAVWEEGAPIYTAEAGNDTIICKGDSFSIGKHNLDEYLYAWSPSIGLSDSSIGNPICKPSVTTKYYLHVKDFKFDETIDSITVFVSDHCDTLSIENYQLKIINSPLSFNIFPNPSNGEIIVEYTGDSLCNATFELYNIYGVKLIKENINNKKQRIVLKSIEEGVYLYQINNCDAIVNKSKLIIIKQ